MAPEIDLIVVSNKAWVQWKEMPCLNAHAVERPVFVPVVIAKLFLVEPYKTRNNIDIDMK